jgi:hypothetical protein
MYVPSKSNNSKKTRKKIIFFVGVLNFKKPDIRGRKERMCVPWRSA